MLEHFSRVISRCFVRRESIIGTHKSDVMQHHHDHFAPNTTADHGDCRLSCCDLHEVVMIVWPRPYWAICNILSCVTNDDGNFTRLL